MSILAAGSLRRRRRRHRSRRQHAWLSPSRAPVPCNTSCNVLLCCIRDISNSGYTRLAAVIHCLETNVQWPKSTIESVTKPSRVELSLSISLPTIIVRVVAIGLPFTGDPPVRLPFCIPAQHMADTRTALPLPTPSPASSSSLLQPNSFNHRTPSLSLSSRDKQGSEASAANGNGSGSAPDRRQLSQTASSDGATDATTVAPDLNGFDNASSTSHGTRPHHRRDESQASQLSQLSSSHASTVSHTLHDSHPASLVSTPQAARSISPRLSPRPLQQPLQPPLSRRLSTDRRVRSEALPETKRHLSITGRRPSVLTGGYESSTDEEEREHRHGSGSQGERLRGASAGHLAGVPHLNGQPNGSDSLLGPARSHLTATGGRRRAHSLMSPPNVEFSPPISPARRPSRLRPPSSGSPYPRTGSGTGSPGGTLRATSDGFHHPLAHASSSRVTSTRSVRTEDEQRRRKRSSSKMPAEPKRNPLAESLGLGIAPGQAVLSPDQIENLLGDVDVSNAMKMMAKPPRRQSSVIEGQNWQPQSPPLVARSPPMTAKPFLVSAPPPLTNGDWEGRHRGSSVSSSIATPTPLRNVTPAAPSRRQRTFSVSDSDGGHVPFTHHVPPTQPQPESDIDEGDETVPAAPVETEPPAEMEQLPPPIVTTATPVSDTKGKDKEKDKKRISGLFSLRKKPHRTLSPPPTTSPSRHLAPSPRHDPEAGALREREAEMRLAEQERREDELSQGVYRTARADNRTTLPRYDADPRPPVLPTPSPTCRYPF